MFGISDQFASTAIEVAHNVVGYGFQAAVFAGIVAAVFGVSNSLSRPRPSEKAKSISFQDIAGSQPKF